LQTIPLKEYDLSAGLYLIATPIGNNNDISVRSLEYLQSVDLIACEDTRDLKRLVRHWQLKECKTIAYHQHNEASSAKGIIEQIKQGKSVALVSDAGTINISDPGAILIRQCLQESIAITSLPGPSSLSTALSLYPHHCDFCFHGFIDKKSKSRKEQLESTRNEMAHIFFESAHRIIQHLEEAASIFPEREILICKDLSKSFEQIHFGKLLDLSQNLPLEEGKGEFVLIYSPYSDEKDNAEFLEKSIRIALQAGLKNGAIWDWLKAHSNLKRKDFYNHIEKLKQHGKT
tara:strand:+ start:3956 stop:4819 length:864 start_codon:yes stop_codon:yes gene_type:complete